MPWAGLAEQRIAEALALRDRSRNPAGLASQSPVVAIRICRSGYKNDMTTSRSASATITIQNSERREFPEVSVGPRLLEMRLYFATTEHLQSAFLTILYMMSFVLHALLLATFVSAT